MVRKDIKIREITNINSTNDNIEVLGLQIVGLAKELTILAFYRRPGEVVERGSWKKIVEKVGQRKNVLCIGDFNAHSQLWNCEKTDRNREILQEEIEDCELYIINRDTLNRVEGGRRHSNLDLGFESEELICLTKYKQIDDTWGTDHYSIEFEIGISRKIYRKRTNRISTKKNRLEDV